MLEARGLHPKFVGQSDLESLMASAGFVDVATITADGGTGNLTYLLYFRYCQLILILFTK